jgi:hypothetical protein
MLMTNRLAQETSPYLQQHAGNPVDWYPWGEEALGRARDEDKPILLSIGYSACHWCHVMAHESFEDPQVAALMNRHFINVKVDREERPDLDQIYQTAHQMLAQRAGGWPLTMFLAPDGTPFFGGTYFPKSARFGLPGFPQLLERVAEVYRTQRGEIHEQNQALLGGLLRTVPAGSAHRSEFTDAPARRLAEALLSSFDRVHGGFGPAPKFPHPTDLDFLLRRAVSTGDAKLLEPVTTTLTRMAEGGIYDQVGGGFCRYSVDGEWTIPHFEKMLYDNGPLLRLYADAWVATREPLYRTVAEQTAAWVMREMQSPEGGYYSSLDADSEHQEGRFYVWTPQEARALLTPEQFEVAGTHWGLDRPPNFEGRHWHLRVVRPVAQLAGALGRSAEQCEALIAESRERLLAARAARVRPGRDDKILTSWNALMIEGMARASAVFDRGEWLDSARRALDFLRATLWRDGRLLATCKDGRANLNAYLDDHAFLLCALLELLQAEFRADDLAFAEELAEELLDRFEDREAGGFYFTSHDHERLIHRPKTGHDGATPSGNAIAAFALQRLGHLTGETRYLAAAERALELYYPQLDRQPGGHASFGLALQEHLTPPSVVVLRGPPGDAGPWLARLRDRYHPHTIALFVASGTGDLPPVLDKPAGDRVNAWVCSGVDCLAPIDDAAQLERVLAAPAAQPARVRSQS